MNDLARLNARIRAIKRAGLAFFVLTLLVWLIASGWRAAMNGLVLGELGGAYVVFSMIRQGHVNDNLQGTALFASGMLGMVTRWLALAVVIVIALKVPNINVYTALIGYLLGFVFIFAGFYGYARNHNETSGAK